MMVAPDASVVTEHQHTAAENCPSSATAPTP